MDEEPLRGNATANSIIIIIIIIIIIVIIIMIITIIIIIIIIIIIRLNLPACYMLLMFVYHAAYSRNIQGNSLWTVTKKRKTERFVKICEWIKLLINYM